MAHLLCDMYIGDHMVTISHRTHHTIATMYSHAHASMIPYQTTVERVPGLMQPNQKTSR